MDYNYNRNVRRRSVSGRGKKRGLRLGSSVVIFALAVCIRAVAPNFAQSVSGQLRGAIDHSVDYRAAFSAVGSFVSGDSTLDDTIAVLKGNGEAQPVMAEVARPSGAAQYNLQSMYLQCLEAGLERQRAAEAMAEVSYEAEPELPDNVCAELVELPFEYTRPVLGVKSSGFGYRDHPIDKVNKFHYGMDFAADEGDDIFAFADGHVAASGVSETAGNYLIISHGNGWTTQYFHCSEVSATVGNRVERGQVVAAVGQTGAATGPHLHFELIRDGVYHDPGLYLNEQG